MLTVSAADYVQLQPRQF